MESKNVYFQFNPGNTFNIFIRTSHDENIEKIKIFLTEHKFEEISEDVYKNILKKKQPYRMLDFSKATATLARSINSVRSELDIYGKEQITPNKNYFVYRYHRIAMMVYSFNTRVWDLGYICDFENADDVTALSITLRRYLNWSLAEFGVVGFWANVVTEGIVIQKPSEVNFEVVFFDVKKDLIYSKEGTRKISAPFEIIRLDETMSGKTRSMNSSELYSFLMTKTAYFSYSGLPKSLQTIMFELAGKVDGIVYPKENFENRATPSVNA